MISIQQFSTAAASADRVLVSTGENGESSLKAANYTLKDKAVLCLTSVPLFRNSSYVKDYVAQLNTGNAAATEAFLQTLSECYGTKAASAAREAWANSDAPLTNRSIKSMSEIAENLRGQGEAKSSNRHVVVRIWPQEGLEHVGHASVTVKNSSNPSPKRQVNEHVSWWPAKTPEGGNISRFFSQVRAAPLSHYRSDKSHEIAQRTEERLQSGEFARQQIKDGESSPELEKLAQYKPRAIQKKSGDGKWGVTAQKVYLPMAGNTKDMGTGKKNFVLFGLNEKRILADAKQVKEDASTGKLGFTLASKTENCSAITARMLKSGGSENFSKFRGAWISEGPNEIQGYAKTVQAEVDSLNKKANNIERKFSEKIKDSDFKVVSNDFKRMVLTPTHSEVVELRQQLQRSKDPAAQQALQLQIKERMDAQISELCDYFKGEGYSQPESSQKSVSSVREKIYSNAPNSNDSFDTLTLKAKEIVLAMDSFLEKSGDVSSEVDMTTFLLGRSMLDRTREFMKAQV